MKRSGYWKIIETRLQCYDGGRQKDDCFNPPFTLYDAMALPSVRTIGPNVNERPNSEVWIVYTRKGKKEKNKFVTWLETLLKSREFC